jgi:predicted ArsR family transcriptional regulator
LTISILPGSQTILNIDQLPYSRRSILIALKRSPSTIAQLAEAMQLTGEAVRQQLLQLHRDGWIESRSARAPGDPARTGRPATLYRLSAAGDHLFPKGYDVLAITILDTVVEELGAGAARRILASITEARIRELEPRLEGLTLEQRVDALRDLYLNDDPYMQSEKVEDGYRLVERNCPFYNTAMARPMLCSVSVNSLSRLLGVRVAREQKFQDGDGQCVFRVFESEPIDSEGAPFMLESELEERAG